MMSNALRWKWSCVLAAVRRVWLAVLLKAQTSRSAPQLKLGAVLPMRSRDY
jgi:hypothetical protein